MAAADKLVARLNGASDKGKTDHRDSFGSGIKWEWNVWVEVVNSNVELDQVLEGMRIEKFTITGKWTSHVRRDHYVVGLLVDKQWGDNKRPYGNFTIGARAVDGGITSNVNIHVDRYNDSADQYAKEKAEGLIRSIVATTVAG